jgi:hypothetical protein
LDLFFFFSPLFSLDFPGCEPFEVAWSFPHPLFLCSVTLCPTVCSVSFFFFLLLTLPLLASDGLNRRHLGRSPARTRFSVLWRCAHPLRCAPLRSARFSPCASASGRTVSDAGSSPSSLWFLICGSCERAVD